MNIAILLMLSLAPGCLEVVDARITAGHLKALVSELAPINDGVEFGYAPAPGTTRWIRSAELADFSSKYGVGIEHVPEICVTRRAQVLTSESVESAIRRSLDRLIPGEKAHIEIIDYVRLPLPKGEIVFSPRGIYAAPKGAFLWRGKVEYDHNRSVPVWVTAKITVHRPALHARTAIAEGHLISDEDMETRSAAVPLDEALKSKETFEAAGMTAMFDIEPGQRITQRLLTRPLAVNRGDSVRAVSEAGSVRLTIDALALRAGRVGDVIPIENKTNKRTLRATIMTPGQVQILQEGNENEKNRRVRDVGGASSAGGKRQDGAETDASRGAH